MPLPDSIENLRNQADVPSADHFEDLHRAVSETEAHLTLLTRTHGPALVAVLADLVDDLRHAAHGAQRATATQRGGLLRSLDDAHARLRECAEHEAQTMETFEALLEEVERRNRRSHAATSRSVAKARRLVDQYHLDQS